MTDTTTTLPAANSATGLSTSPTWRLHWICPLSPLVERIAVVPAGAAVVLGRSADLALPDARLSRQHARLVAHGPKGVEVVDLASKNGTFVDGRPVKTAWCGHGSVLRLGDCLAVVEADLGADGDQTTETAAVPGHSEAARRLRGAIARTADHRRPVLVTGPTGSGKELVVSAIHAAAAPQGRLVRLNIAAVPAELFESELFGHSRGAFSGAASDRLGRVREAHHGTLLLDEVAELPLPLQAKLLRVIEEGVVRPIGASNDIAVEVRFVACTHTNLAEQVSLGRFRRDLAARLSMETVHVPALADRRADLSHLADVVLPVDGGHSWSAALSAELWEHLLLRDWPANLRGLLAALLPLRRAVEPGKRLSVQRGLALLEPGMGNRTQAANDLRRGGQWRATDARPSAETLRELLHRHRGQISNVASELQRDRRQVYRWLESAGIAADEVMKFRES